VPNPEHVIYPYLLSGFDINQSNQVWCADITYIPIKRGFLYLVAIMDWYSRKVLSWGISNTMDAGFCVEALGEAITHYGKPEIFNTDQAQSIHQLLFYQYPQRPRDQNLNGRHGTLDGQCIY
jgi:putative transposase